MKLDKSQEKKLMVLQKIYDYHEAESAVHISMAFTDKVIEGMLGGVSEYKKYKNR